MGSQYPPKTILVVDDNRDAADLTAELLALHGYITVVAYGGNEGIEAAQRFLPDVVLLDIGMPGLNGYDVALAIRKISALDHSTLVAYTAWNDTAARQKAAESGFDRHLRKPANIEEILQSISVSQHS